MHRQGIGIAGNNEGGKQVLLRLLEDERGQAIAEYAILAVLFSGVLAGVSGLLLRSFETYYRQTASWINLPLP